MNIRKRDGSLEPFQRAKIVNSCILAGISWELAEQIAEKIEKRIYINMPTSRMRALVIKYLRRYDKKAAERYEKYIEILPEKKRAFRHKRPKEKKARRRKLRVSRARRK